MATRAQPEWKSPINGFDCGIKVYNSLTKTKVPLLPHSGRTLRWYTCGPTVYDSPHLGHARTYVIFDVLRRVLRDYFGYDIFMVMNITDIDDKIIIKANKENEAFNAISMKYEKEFLDSMQRLGVQLPDVMTRVSEYVPEIVAYIQKIIENGYGYESNGSVYFDTAKFNDEHKHFYGKLEPNSVGNDALLNEGEGSLSVATEKRCRHDFALWKKSKEGEPFWDSPWGSGRPGWHIECSAMASDILGEVLDIHSGGCDLRFPHHDNEIAQCEAYFESGQWVNYFLHSGHLNIEGLKMSKSLKNFITIDTILQNYTARQLRMFFMMHKYDSGLDLNDSGLQLAVEKDKKFSEFFQNVKVLLRTLSLEASQRWETKDKRLYAELLKTKSLVHEFLQDNFNIPAVLHELSELVNKTNIYMSEPNPRGPLIRSVADYLTHMFKVFGLINDTKEFGFTVAETTNTEEILSPFLDAFTQFRDEVREAAKSKDTSRLLQICDSIRDDVLPELGVRIEDRGTDKSVWKLEDKTTLRMEREQKKAAQAAAEAAKLQAKEAAKKKNEEKERKARVDPAKMFLDQTDKYSAFDEKGVPTHGNDGQPLSKNARKKLEKEFQQQVELHANYLLSRTSVHEGEAAPSS
eukprot:TRINITY_DN4261_c0_g1_i1.p1 TRINITY_DN4261_c0_g1~~TRINITY_DN4261_c0_g1_i1.p1  ORF type:complete len:633 (-),score=155.01 TRINITY_DN4261_c0_g1_i1:621-2519(-)